MFAAPKRKHKMLMQLRSIGKRSPARFFIGKKLSRFQNYLKGTNIRGTYF